MSRLYYAIIIIVLLSLSTARPQLSRAQALVEPPTNVQAQAIEGAQAVRITWQASAAPGVFYKIYRSQASGSNGEAIVSFLSAPTYTDVNVAFNNVYYYRLAARISDVESQLSSQVSAKPVVPGPLNIQAADTKKGGEIKISWERPPGLLLKFSVYRSTADNTLGGAVATGVEGTEYFDAGAVNNTYYYYRVASVYANGQQSEPSALVIGRASDGTPPERPIVSASAYEGGRVSVSWSTPRNEQSLRYFVYRSGSASDLGSLVVETTNTSFSESALDPNRILYYYVIAKDGSGNVSAPSEPARLVTVGAAGVARQQLKVSDLTAEGTLNRSEIQLRWKLPSSSDIAYSRVYRRPAGSDKNSSAMIADKVYGSSHLDKTAVGGGRYYYFIRLMDKNGYEYESSAEVSATAFTEPSVGSIVNDAPGNQTPKAPEAPAPRPVQNKPTLKQLTDPKNRPYAYGRPRMADLKLEAALANNLRKALVKKLGAKKVPARLHQNLIKAYIYGGYVVEEIAQTIIKGPGLVHPSVRAVEWRRSQEYKKHKSRTFL